MICIDYTCDLCIHRHAVLLDGWNVACDAFPNGIPKGWLNVDVTALAECANGIKFEQMDEPASEKRAG